MRSGKPRFCVIVDLVINQEYVLLNKGGGGETGPRVSVSPEWPKKNKNGDDL